MAVGNSAGIILPKEILARRNVEKGDTLCGAETLPGLAVNPIAYSASLSNNVQMETPYLVNETPELTERASHRGLNFRPDIEGLRAIAILLVVAFHAGIPGFGSGFIGVDVFFVLSGYLITDLLAGEVERTGTLNFSRFYARRMRRLLPASFLMLICVLAGGALLLSPIEEQSLSKAGLATAGYVSNIYFLMQATDYFGHVVNWNPLVHTWSLAVEEQFYLLWPLLVLLTLRRRASLRLHIAMLSAIGILSLASCIVLTHQLQPVAFFFTVPRAWEFAAGALATRMDGERVMKFFRFEAVAWLGVALMLGAGMLIKPAAGFPGAIAMVPVAGTAIVLIAGKRANPNALLYSILNSRIFQAIGGLSYSWYLWHWPVLVFARILNPYWKDPLPSVLLLLLSLAIAWMTHVSIENPVRFSRRLWVSTAYSLALGLALTCAGLFAAGAFEVLAGRQAISPQQAMFTEASAGNFTVDRVCTVGFRRDQLKTCFFGPENGTTVVLVGDSHAGQWIPTMEELAGKEKWRVVTLIKASCPLVVAHVYNPKLETEEPECASWRRAALDYITKLKPAVVVMSSSWDYVKNPWLNDAVSQLTPQQWEAGTRVALQRLNDASSHVILLRDTPHPGFLTPVCLARAAAHPRLFSARACDVEESKTLTPQVWQAETSAARGLAHVSTLDLTGNFCAAGVCPAMLNGMVVYRDSTHMTFAFAGSLEPVLADRLRAEIGPNPDPR